MRSLLFVQDLEYLALEFCGSASETAAQQRIDLFLLRPRDFQRLGDPLGYGKTPLLLVEDSIDRQYVGELQSIYEPTLYHLPEREPNKAVNPRHLRESVKGLRERNRQLWKTFLPVEGAWLGSERRIGSVLKSMVLGRRRVTAVVIWTQRGGETQACCFR